MEIYQNKNKHLYVSQKYISPTGHKLGIWVNKCRMEYRSGKLSHERILDLEAFDDWVWEPLTYKWKEIYSKISELRSLQKNTLDLEIIPGVFVGTWLKLQRVNLEKLPEGKQKLLAKLSDE